VHADLRWSAALAARARLAVVSDARTLNAWRRWGYRLLPGELNSICCHMRPAEWPIMGGNTLLAMCRVGCRSGREHLGRRFALWSSWVVFLNAGTSRSIACSTRMRATSDISTPAGAPAVPAALQRVLLVAGQLLALTLPLGFQIAYAICFVLRSCIGPPFRFKAVAGVDWTSTCGAFGTLTGPTPRGPDRPAARCGHALVLLASARCRRGSNPLTQLYQFEAGIGPLTGPS